MEGTKSSFSTASAKQENVVNTKLEETKSSSTLSPEKVFKCSRCNFSAKYDYFGKNPSFCRTLSALEDVYIMRDPFTEERRAILLGSHCTACTDLVCSSQECSLYYTRRFCLQCVSANQNEFPSQIVMEVKKRQATSTEHWTCVFISYRLKWCMMFIDHSFYFIQLVLYSRTSSINSSALLLAQAWVFLSYSLCIWTVADLFLYLINHFSIWLIFVWRFAKTMNYNCRVA